MGAKIKMSINSHGANIRYYAKKYNKKPEDIVDFSSNINIFSPNINYKSIILNIKNNINKYPDINYENLKSSISAIYDVESSFIHVGNGATEIIYDVIGLDIFKNIGIFNPTFSEYEKACIYHKKNVLDLDINLLDNLKEVQDINKIKSMIFKDNIYPDILIICNPNNPTGKIYELKNLLEFCKKNNIFLLIDETFIDFCYNDEYSLKLYINKYDNLIVINAITKFFAMAGARLGFSFCGNFQINDMLNIQKKPWSVNILAENIVYEIERLDKSYYEKTKSYYTGEIKRLYLMYSSLKNLEISDSKTCFLHLEMKNICAKKLQDHLIKNKNMLVRLLDNYKNINKNSIRICIKDSVHNDNLFFEIKKYLEDYEKNSNNMRTYGSGQNGGIN